MFYAHTTFIGVDPTAGTRPFVFAALDADLGLLALGQGDIDTALAFVAGQRQAFVAVCAPRQPNLGLLQREGVRANLTPQPRPGRWQGYRLAEYLLRQHNIGIPRTAANEHDCPNWMQMGFHFYRRLESLGYQANPGEPNGKQSLEVYPHACYTALLGRSPFPKHSLEGRLQRQLVLYENQLAVPDPMRFFEEITRHKLLKGYLPEENLYSPGELDALVAAYTAWILASHPEQTCQVGDSEEGQVTLPVKELKTRY